MRANRLLAVAALAAFTPSLHAQLTWQRAGNRPAARAGHFAFFDAARGRVTVFGGQDSPTTQAADCWQFDDAWVQMTMPAVTGRGYGSAGEDPVEGTGLVFGGIDSNGTLVPGTLRWNRELHRFDVLSPATTPPLRWVTAMATDTSRRRAVLFGGGNASGTLGDTWEWDGGNWLQRTPAQSPPQRGNHCMAYDAVSNRVLLFGGHNGASLNDTWAWDGSNWTDVSGTFRPAPVHNAMMAFDGNRGVMVLFGGKNDAGTPGNACWERQGSSWTGPTSPTVSPAPRELGSITYDARRRKLVLVGGVGVAGARLDDVWEHDVSGWTERTPQAATGTSGTERSNHAAAYDSELGHMITFGGSQQNGTVHGDLSETNGSAWVRRFAPAPFPSGRTQAEMVYDSHRHYVCMFGGRDGSTLSDNMLWMWSAQSQSWGTAGGGASAPLTPVGHGLAYDSARRKIVLFGGNNSFGGSNETWEYDAVNGWLMHAPVQSPAARYGHAMAFHQAAGGCYVFGGTLSNGPTTNQLWFWNGSNWTNPLPGVGPPAVTECGMCYDPGRNCLVVFGGHNGAFVNGQVYELHGNNWLLRTPASTARPAARTGCSLVYDSKNRRCVVYGGSSSNQYFSDVWEWDGTAATWTLRPHGRVPEPRAEHTLSHDPARGRTILFGGYDGNHTFDDTWEWYGGGWTPKVPVWAGPVPRHSTMTAFDQGTGTTVLFGGVSATGQELADTWMLTGSNWNLFALGTPSPRFNHAMVSLAPAPGVLLFGGYSAGSQLGDGYRWNNFTWTPVAAGPGARDIHAMACDQIRMRVVLFGGRNFSGLPLNDTWEFVLATSSWVQRTPAQSPPGRWNHAMTFDAGRGRVVMTGGHNGGSGYDDLWEWDGTNWLQRTPETSKPPASWNSALIYDRGRGRCVAFGGDTNAGQTNELWEYSAVIDVAGSGNTANPAAMRYYSQPVLGQPLRLGTSLPTGVGGYLLGFGPVQQPLVQIGAPPLCEPGNVWANLVTFLVLGTSEPNFTWNVPNTPMIVGVTLVFQAASVQPANCFRASDALQVQFR